MNGVVHAAVLAVLSSALVALPAALEPAQAITNADFNPGYIISDERFFDAGSMSETQIQQFLVARVPACVAAYGVPCLKSYTETTFSRAAVGTGRCSAYDGAENESAARIIAKVAVACNISPQVLLVLLQKEQGLVTKTSPTAIAYRSATGYGCPDTSACDARYYGFYNQVYMAAWQFRQYTYNPTARTYKIGINNIQYHPNAACGRPATQIYNQATANLYNYTPYQPNAAAMANLRGVGDSCSSYGNRNFWVYFNDWFGSPTGSISPIGTIDSVTPAPGGLRVRGWAIDPITSESIAVHAYANGAFATSAPANGTRGDIAAAYPSVGSQHGFDFVVPIGSGGATTVCVFGINVGPGVNTLLECQGGTVLQGDPTGYLDSVSPVVNGVNFGGWAIDPDTADAVSIHVYVDGTPQAFTADVSRADLGDQWGGYGTGHGFQGSMTATPGLHRVCAYAINVGAGSVNSQLGCRTVSVPAPITESGRAPIGSLDSAVVDGANVTLSGWSIDQDTASAIKVQLLVDGVVGATVNADQQRADVGAVYAGYGAGHGFSAAVPIAAGTHTVCAVGVNSAGATNTSLGCRTVTAAAPPTEQGRSPIGRVDTITRVSTGFVVSGWALDPDTAAPVAVSIVVDFTATPFTANGWRSDIGAAYPAHGSSHGFTAAVTAGPGTHNVCAYAIDSVSSVSTLLSCTLLPG